MKDYKIIRLYGAQAAIFTLTNGERHVFMKVSRSNFNNTERFIVMVDAGRFLDLWKNDPDTSHSNLSHGDPVTWRNDYKFHDADNGFNSGEGNPVPVASVSCQTYPCLPPPRWQFWKKHEAKVVPYVRFTNGITRTIWLLAHGFCQFPVECSRWDAERLNELAGIGEPIRSVEDLIPDGTPPWIPESSNDGEGLAHKPGWRNHSLGKCGEADNKASKQSAPD